jgi:LAGLIDADG endonuclease
MLLAILRSKNNKIGRRVRLYFEITLHKKDKVLLELIKKDISVGNIFDKVNDSIQYSVTSVKELQIIREHFDKYPLHTKKRADFEL